MDMARLQKQIQFCEEIDKEKLIGRQNYLSDGNRKENDAGDTFAYDEEAKKTQRQRELVAADRIFGMLPEDQAVKFRQLWDEFEECKTPEAKFARTMDNIQPAMLNSASNGKSWKENEVRLSQILNRNKNTAEGSKVLWDYSYNHFIRPNVEKGKIEEDVIRQN